MNLPEIETKIAELEKKKYELIEHIRQFNRRLRYKEYEQKALAPFVEQTQGIHTGFLRRQKNAIEFRIATEAYTPRMEREWLKEVRELDGKLESAREVEWARRKLQLVKGDIEECQKGIGGIEEQLKVIREDLKKLYDEMHAVRNAARKVVKFAGFEDDLVTLGDIGIIETERKA